MDKNDRRKADLEAAAIWGIGGAFTLVFLFGLLILGWATENKVVPDVTAMIWQGLTYFFYIGGAAAILGMAWISASVGFALLKLSKQVEIDSK